MEKTAKTHEQIWEDVISCAKSVNLLIMKSAEDFGFCGASRWLFYGRVINMVFRCHYGFVLKTADEMLDAKEKEGV